MDVDMVTVSVANQGLHWRYEMIAIKLQFTLDRGQKV